MELPAVFYPSGHMTFPCCSLGPNENNVKMVLEIKYL